MRRITFSSVIVLMLVMMALLAANLPPLRAQPDPLTLECLITPNPTEAGQVTNFYSASSGGVPPYSWAWTVNGAPVATTQNTTHTFDTAGIYTVCINVTDSLNNWKQCCTDVTVNQDLSLVCNVTPNPTKVDHATNFTASASGGAGNYTWLWTIDGTPVVTVGQNITHNFTVAGNYTVCANVTDSSGNWTQCCKNVTVNEALSLECDVNPEPTKVGHVTNFTAGANGGVGNYTWSWMVNGTEEATTQNTTHIFTTAGNYTVCVNVTDSLDNKEQCCTNVTVIDALSLTCNITPNPTKVDHVTNFTAVAIGGAGNYSWLWTIDGTPLAVGQNITHNFTVAGNYTVCVNVTDSSLNWTQCCTNVTVNEALSLECRASANMTKVGQAINWTACADGGVRPYSWSWMVDDVERASFNDAACTNFTYAFNETGAYEVCVNVTDSLDNEYQCCTNVTVSEALNLTCDVRPNPTKVGHVTNFTAAAGEGVPPYSWSWTVNGAEVATTQNTTHIFASAGNYTVCINVTDSLDNKEQCCTNVTANEALILECEVNPDPTKVGHVTNFTAGASGGIPPYTWSWTVNGIEVATTQNTLHLFATAGNYTVCVNVTDSSLNWTQCCTNVTVNPALSLECLISPNPTKVGRVTNFTAAAGGGVPPYTWSWTVNGTEIGTTQSTTYTFNTTGNYNVCINVTDSLENKKQCCTDVTVNPALSLVLLPATDTNLVGTTHSLTATVYDQFNNVMEGVNLTWTIESGPGSFISQDTATNASGQADAVITSNVAGTSTVRCEVANNTSVFDTATKTWTVKVPPRGGGGGGCPPIRYLTVDWDGNNVTKRLLSNDELSVDLLGLSTDGCNRLLLEQGTHAPTVGEQVYYLIVIRELELEDIPPLPDNTVAIVAVDITPEGAVFNKDIILTLCFDQLPDNALDTTINYYDDVSGVWVPLESTLGELDGMLTISAPLRHFTIFAVLVELAPPSPPPPAHFAASGLNIVTSVEKIWETVTFVTKTGENITITANVANDGGQEGTYTVELKLDGEEVDTEIVTLGAGQSRQVSFTLSEMNYGQHEVEVDGLSGEFTTSRTITWWLIIVIIVAIGLIIWGVIWFRRRRKARQAA